jgi:hypothetical protein
MAKTNVATKYISEQPADKAALLKKLDAAVVKGMPDAEVVMKWGVPVYMSGGRNICAIAGFKEHVAVNFFVPPAGLPDPKKKLEGGKTTRTLRVRSASEIDTAAVVGWVKAASAWHRAKAK